MPCGSLLLVTPKSGEIDMMSELTTRQILANNDVISTACGGKK